MSVTRRTFILGTTYAGAGIAVVGAIRPLAAATKPLVPWESAESQLAPYLTGLRMAATPSTAYRAYRSKVVANPEVTTWAQVDLGKSVSIEAIQLFPASERRYPGRDQWYAGEGFPLRFRIDASDDPSFNSSLTIADFTHGIGFSRPAGQHHSICGAWNSRPLCQIDGNATPPC